MIDGNFDPSLLNGAKGNYLSSRPSRLNPDDRDWNAARFDLQVTLGAIVNSATVAAIPTCVKTMPYPDTQEGGLEAFVRYRNATTQPFRDLAVNDPEIFVNMADESGGPGRYCIDALNILSVIHWFYQ
jgi:hypothetical protein